MKLKPYLEYKDSGVPWLGKVPEHWDLRKIKFLFNERVQKGFPDEPLLVASQTKGVILKTNYENRTVVVQKDFHLLKLVKKGDFVISLRSFQGGIELAHFQGIISPAYTIMVPGELIDIGYFKHLAKSNLFIELLKTCVTGIREGQNIDYEILKRHKISIPSLKEQRQIARFLDFKTSQISRFIRAKKRIIELLKEQKQVIINQAVTRGLDPNVKLKPSGVEWLGEIPEGWEIRYFFQTFKEKCVKNYGGKEQNRLSLSYGQIIRKSIDATEGLLPLSYETYQIVNHGDIILRLTDLQNDHKSLRVGFVNETGIITSAYLCLVVFGEIIPEFAALLLHVYDLRKIFYGMGGGVRQSIGFSELKRLPFLVPPIKEQKNIINQIQIKTVDIDSSIDRFEKEISLMQEYRTRLIADVVTGKVDVRDIEVPDVAEEEIIDEVSEDSDDDQTSDDSLTDDPEDVA
jgi:type I restriction enzyme S subunit